MLLKVDRILLRVPHLPAAIRFYTESLGLKLLKEDKRLALLQFSNDDAELVIHTDPDLPGEATYYLVENVRDLFAKRAELKLTFVNPPSPSARGYRATLKDPFGNSLLIVDRTNESSSVVEDAKPPGALFAGMEEKAPVIKDALIETYQQIGRTADDLPYTPDFERLYAVYAAKHRDKQPHKHEVWRHLLNLRKSGKLPKMGEAKSKPPSVSEEDRQRLRELLGEDIGRRDRLPYTERFDQMVNAFNKPLPRKLSPHLVWRLVATLAK